MSIKYLPGLVAVVLLALTAPALAALNSPTLLYTNPTADVLPAGTLAITADMTYPLVRTSMNTNYLEANASIRFSPLKHLDLAVTAYTFSDYVLDAKYQILGGEPDRFGLAVGVADIGFYDYISPIGHDSANAWPDWKYRNNMSTELVRTHERFSAFAVTSIPVTKFARLHVGVGRGRFVGYSEHSRYFNSDFFYNDQYHQWAVALFGGAEVYVHPRVALVAEASTRDLNSGVKASFGPFDAMVAWTKMEGMFFPKETAPWDEKFGRLYAGVTYRFSNWDAFRPRESYCLPPMEPVPPPEPVPVPTGRDPRELKFELLPIYFDLDQSNIRPGDAEILKRNAEAILAKAKAGLKADVLIDGHCCPLASEMYNVGLGMRRAEAAKAYLVGLGVGAALLTTETFGEAYPPYTDPAEYHLDRRCEFKWKY